MRSIMAMARNDVYKGRGLKLPEHLLKHDGEPDLCSSCAKGKPTITRSHIRRQRASKKGGLWFFDVSGGGKRVPSLIEGNIYLYLFVDSYSRKYFPYYSKKRDEKETLRIMKLHFETSIAGFVQHDDEVVYHQVTSIQGDNGELKTTSVASYLMKKGIISRYTRPYHPESNGMPERAFRTIYELAISMLVHAGLPEPYWQWATSSLMHAL